MEMDLSTERENITPERLSHRGEGDFPGPWLCVDGQGRQEPAGWTHMEQEADWLQTQASSQVQGAAIGN